MNTAMIKSFLKMYKMNTDNKPITPKKHGIDDIPDILDESKTKAEFERILRGWVNDLIHSGLEYTKIIEAASFACNKKWHVNIKTLHGGIDFLLKIIEDLDNGGRHGTNLVSKA